MSVRSKPTNPFSFGIDIPDEYFCDREKETEHIIKLLKNGSNIVLKAPRRIGKSSLIKHVLKQKEIKDSFNTFFVDIYGTKDMQGLISEFQKSFLSSPLTQTEKGRKSIQELFQRICLQATVDGAGIFSGFGIALQPVQEPSYSFNEICRYLEKTKKPNIVVFDEFQTIQQYKEKAAAIIRTQVQQMNNTKFIFAGSERHMLMNMFENPNEPFYRSSRGMDLELIPKETYVSFCSGIFAKYGKGISKDSVRILYDVFSGNTYGMQETMQVAFPEIKAGETATTQDLMAAIKTLLKERDAEFRSIFNSIDSPKIHRLLACIAYEGLADGLTSAEKMKRYGLDNASSVQNGLAVLERKDIIQKTSKGQYEIKDRFLELWLAWQGGLFDSKINSSAERFRKETAAITTMKVPFPKNTKSTKA